MPSFYDQLLGVIGEVNLRNPDRAKPISLRQCVRDGMNLHDAYASKIKDGVYFPSYDRLEALAKYLGVNPARFDLYIKRYAQRALGEDRARGAEDIEPDPDIMLIFRMLAEQNKTVQNLLKKILVRDLQQRLSSSGKSRNAA